MQKFLTREPMEKRNMSLNVFFQLLKRDLKAFWREYPGKLFDTAFLLFTNIIVFAYFMTDEWVQPGYGPFLLVGAIASFGLIEIIGKVSVFIGDLESERTISQSLILPIRTEMVFIYIAIFWALSSLLLSFLLFPLGKLLLYDRFEIMKMSFIRLIPIYISSNLFYGFFALWLSSILKGMGGISGLWMRFINPMWMFGAYFYSWKGVYELSPVIGYISLINPMVYIMEGMRAAALGQQGYLPYWICLVVIWVFIFGCSFHAIHRLKKRLDCL